MRVRVGVALLSVLALPVCLARPAAAENEAFPFSGFYVRGVYDDKIAPADLELRCLTAPRYVDQTGTEYQYQLDLSQFRSTGQLHYTVSDTGLRSRFIEPANLIMVFPDPAPGKDPYYSMDTQFRVLKRAYEAGYTFLRYDGFSTYQVDIQASTDKRGQGAAMARCPFSEARYLALAAEGQGNQQVGQLSVASLEPDAKLAADLAAAAAQLR